MEYDFTKCPIHGKYCMIKTGMKPGPNKGKTFNICLNPECSFSNETKRCTAICSVHKESTLVQILLRNNMIYSRCPVGLEQKKKWCSIEKCASNTNKEVKKEKSDLKQTENLIEIKSELVKQEYGVKSSTAVTEKEDKENKVAKCEPMSIQQNTRSAPDPVSVKREIHNSQQIQEQHIDKTPEMLHNEDKKNEIIKKTLPQSSLFGLIKSSERNIPMSLDKSIQDSPAFKGFRDRKADSDIQMKELASVSANLNESLLNMSLHRRTSSDASRQRLISSSDSFPQQSSHTSPQQSSHTSPQQSSHTSPQQSRHTSPQQSSHTSPQRLISSSDSSSQRSSDAPIQLSSDVSPPSSHDAPPPRSHDARSAAPVHPYTICIDSDSDEESPSTTTAGIKSTTSSSGRVVAPMPLPKPRSSSTLHSAPANTQNQPNAHLPDRSQAVYPPPPAQPPLQPTLQQPVAKVTSFDYDHYRNLMMQKSQFSNTLRNQQRLAQSMDMSQISDGGVKFRSCILKVQKSIDDLVYEINDIEEFCKNNGIDPTIKPQRMMNQFGQYVDNTNIVAPNSSTASALYQQMYGNQNTQNALYGGRMTGARKQEVQNVTTEALDCIHKQLSSIPPDTAEHKDPEGLNVKLMPHQRQGLAWMMWRELQKPSGGILADDMGLGKTISMISLILLERQITSSDNVAWLKKNKDTKCINSHATLIICPASLIHQWKSEIERRTTMNMKIIMFHGATREKDHNVLARADIVITTYNIVSKDIAITKEMKNDKIYDKPLSEVDKESIGRSVLLKVKWRRLICDEAHTLKNYKSLMSISTCRLNACSRWALTGTPIQNTLLDMFALIRYIRCHPFDEYNMWKHQVDKSAKGKQRLNLLVNTLVKRRTKQQIDPATGQPIVKLPDKICETHSLSISDSERLIYDRLFIQSKAKVEDYVNQQENKNESSGYSIDITKSPNGSMSNTSQSRWAQSLQAKTVALQYSKPLMKSSLSGNKGCEMLMMILRLRQCCSHMSLMKSALNMDALGDEALDLDIAQQFNDLAIEEAQNEAINSEGSVKEIFDRNHRSTKISFILQSIKKILKNEEPSTRKSVIVSQWTSMLSIIEEHLLSEGIECLTIRGDVKPVKRNEFVDTFNGPGGPKVMLVSLRSGGCGLNLIGGSNLFLVDMHWNPALEAQACDRIYRLGQKNNVYIHRFLCKDTIEEKISKLQESKLELAKNVLTGAAKNTNKLSLSDLKMLFDIK